MPARHVTTAAEVGLLVAELLPVLGQRWLVGRHLEREVRHGGRHVEEKRPARVRPHECQLLLGDQVCGVGFPRERCEVAGGRGRLVWDPPAALNLGVVDGDPLAVAPEVPWIERMRLALTVVAEEPLEPAGTRVRGTARRPKPPLAEAAGRIARVTEDRGERHGAGRQWCLPLGLRLAVRADGRVPRVPACQ